MKTREQLQRGYWTGGTIGGVKFYLLTLDRMSLVQSLADGDMPSAERIRAVMAIYALDNHEASQPWEPRALAERGRIFGGFSLESINEFERHFEADMDAYRCSQVRPEGAIDEEDEGKPHVSHRSGEGGRGPLWWLGSLWRRCRGYMSPSCSKSSMRTQPIKGPS